MSDPKQPDPTAGANAAADVDSKIQVQRQQDLDLGTAPTLQPGLGLGLGVGTTIGHSSLAKLNQVVELPRFKAGDTEARYNIAGELGRGGMGLVLRCHDSDLDRDVAMKVMRHCDDQALVVRFIEEARIGGRLQHPGVAPVHDLGIGETGSPFFTMKLVEGLTFAELLLARKDPAEDLRRHLGIFAQVCQAMAFAHSRSIIHCDLKPANIMVGAFSEVYVMDWGLARDLEAGVPVLSDEAVGTIAYMSPEQAHGDHAAIGTRSDVFALGAILIEILTGRPPYTDGNSMTLLYAALSVDLEPALARLRKVNAHPELVALALDCLASDPAKRPQDAGVVAARLDRHLASVEERARNAELAAVAANARAHAERKARNATIVAAIAILFIVAAASAVTVWRKALRQQEATRRLSAVATRAGELYGQAQSAPGAIDELARWQAALDAALAIRNLDEPNAPPELLAQMHEQSSTIETAATRAIANRTFLDRIESLRMAHSQTMDWRLHEAEYAATFNILGIDLDAGTPASVAKTIRATGIGDQIMQALDGWAAARIWSMLPERERLGEIADLADSDEERRRLRRAIYSGELKQVESVAAGNLRQFDARSIDALCLALFHFGNPSLAVDIYRRAAGWHADDFWLHHNLGMLLSMHDPPIATEALIQFLIALAIRPDSAPTWVHAGAMRIERKNFETAEESFLEAIRLNPDLHTAWIDLGIVQKLTERLDEAIKSYRHAFKLKPEDAASAYNLSIALLGIAENADRIKMLQDLDRDSEGDGLLALARSLAHAAANATDQTARDQNHEEAKVFISRKLDLIEAQADETPKETESRRTTLKNLKEDRDLAPIIKSNEALATRLDELLLTLGD